MRTSKGHKEMTPISYMITFRDSIYKHSRITVEATMFDENGKPIKWAVRMGESAMSKKSGLFNHEPLPSSRTGGYLSEYRFNSAEKATQAYWKTRPKAEKIMSEHKSKKSV